ncbi:putative SAM-dependent methyltransferase [Betalipothrixvirus acidiani]|uniref:SAM-dependent methyltransferase n=1 Tax=Betalipothrixvirus acidiani TaxID=346881 RepID=A7WKE9_9VIRU|nr:SAM-dependent methyltransferase [Acidianus filamentous virus 3]CAJ31550.1 putative SAM-dependent methyltransferase [Acidianus filamentous virus 3]
MESIEEYFKKRECDYWREYPHSYGMLNVYQRSIQIVGADCGSSALYFLLRGASFVVQYEKEEHLRKKWEEVCAYFNICNKAVMKGEWDGVYENVDIFVMDCEGCEEKLNVNMLTRYKQWCVGIHDWTKNRVELMRKMEGATFTYVSDDGREITLCKI